MSEHNIPKLQLTIRLDPNGGVSVNGPIQDKIFCLGIMELAKDLILKFKPEEQKKIIVPEMVPGIPRGN